MCAQVQRYLNAKMNTTMNAQVATECNCDKHHQLSSADNQGKCIIEWPSGPDKHED